GGHLQPGIATWCRQLDSPETVIRVKRLQFEIAIRRDADHTGTFEWENRAAMRDRPRDWCRVIRAGHVLGPVRQVIGQIAGGCDDDCALLHRVRHGAPYRLPDRSLLRIVPTVVE